MRRFLLVVNLLVITAFSAFSQVDVEVKEEPLDTIVLISGRSLVGNVQVVSTSRVQYIPYGEKGLKNLDRKQVHKILYRAGTIEHFNSLAVLMVDEDNWQTVIITDDESETEGLFMVGEVSAQSSPQARNARAARKSAEIRMKKRAVNMGGIIVLVTKRESRGGYGEVPTHFVEGLVYGFEPPPEE